MPSWFHFRTLVASWIRRQTVAASPITNEMKPVISAVLRRPSPFATRKASFFDAWLLTEDTATELSETICSRRARKSAVGARGNWSGRASCALSERPIESKVSTKIGVKDGAEQVKLD